MLLEPFLEVPVHHVFSLETTVRLVFEFTILNECAHDLEYQLELMVVATCMRLRLIDALQDALILHFFATLQEAGEDLATPLFLTVAF